MTACCQECTVTRPWPPVRLTRSWFLSSSSSSRCLSPVNRSYSAAGCWPEINTTSTSMRLDTNLRRPLVVFKVSRQASCCLFPHILACTTKYISSHTFHVLFVDDKTSWHFSGRRDCEWDPKYVLHAGIFFFRQMFVKKTENFTENFCKDCDYYRHH